MGEITTKSGKLIEFSVLDCRTIDIISNSDFEDTVSPVTDDNGIGFDWETSGIKLEEFALRKGDKLNTWLLGRPNPYEINYIEKVNNHRYILLSHKRNRSSIYLTPCLRIKNETRLEFMYDYYLINSYLHGNHLILKYRFSPNDAYKNMEHELTKHPYFLNVFEEGYYTNFEFNIPLEFMSDVDNFLIGKYSKFSQKLKNNITKFHGFNDKRCKIVAVLNKYDWLKKRWEEELGVVLDYNIDLDSIPNPYEEQWQFLKK